MSKGQLSRQTAIRTERPYGSRNYVPRPVPTLTLDEAIEGAGLPDGRYPFAEGS